ncbi:MAG: DNA polymerase [Acidobacteria bacterium]|nr:DNA polymerase [Acidobacteriota bacterium]
MQLEAVRIHYPDARQETDGSITFECVICLAEGHPGKRAKLYTNDALSCPRYAAAGSEANRKHCAPMRATLGLGGETAPAWITETLFDGKLTLQCDAAKKEKATVIGLNCDKELSRDTFDLNSLPRRTAFARSIKGFDATERTTIEEALLKLASRRSAVQEVIEDKDDKPVEKVISKILSDGRIIEQVAGCQFAVYDPQRGEVTYSRKVETDEAVYRPLDDDFILKGGLFLPASLIEYGDVATLDAEIEACVYRYSDVPDRERKLSSRYARLTYIADKLNEISYLRATGDRGSGKSRYICTSGMICLRPILVTSPSAASLYRMMDAYHPTLTIDECNLAVGNDDTQTMIQVLNSGFQRITTVSRCEKGDDGQQTVRMFSPFGPKLIGGLKLSDSEAFESRCVSVKLIKTARKDIPFRMTDRMLRDFAELRAKLYLWRLRSLGWDMEAALDKAEQELKNYQIEPRFIQIAIPIYGMIDDEGLKKDFAAMLEGRTDDAKEEKKESFDGQIAGLIHGRLFDVDDEGQAKWKIKGDLLKLEEGEPCEALRAELLVDLLNEGLPEKKKINGATFSRYRLRPLGFKTKQLPSGAYRGRTAIIYSRVSFAHIFETFSLPVPGDFASTASTTEAKPNEDKNISESRQDENEVAKNSCLDAGIYNEPKDLTEVVEAVEADFQEPEGEAILGGCDDQTDAVPSLVALDTETEPFTKNYKDSKTWAKFKAAGKTPVTPQNANMIGLALSYNSDDRTSYTTERGGWRFLMPESRQTVVFHNAKFDLGVLKRAGLPSPEKWEDTMIAAHLICETGEHGLKPLAKTHLGVENPLTFEEADRMRLLDPPVFEEYAKNDARYTYRLWRKFEPEIERQELRRVYELEKSLVPVVMAMEERGMLIDVEALKKAGVELNVRLEALEAEIYDLAGFEFKINSPKALATILTEKLGLKLPKTTKTGQPSVDAESLEELAGEHPIIPPLIEYRETDKLAGAFVEGIPHFADENNRIHPTFKQLGPTSGRFSCSSPNVQQLPRSSGAAKVLRAAFIAGPGRKLVVADWSQVELRIIAHYSEDKAMNKAFTDGADLHTRTASLMFRIPEPSVTKDQRSAAKSVNFGIGYGMGAPGLFTSLSAAGVKTSLPECRKFIESYYRSYPGVKRLQERIEKAARDRGYVRTFFGRRRRLAPDGGNMLSIKNAVIQGSGADIAKDAMVRLHAALPKDAYLIAMIHDEFVVECLEEQAEEVRALMVEVMGKQPEGVTVPLLVEAKIADNWSDAK